MKPAGLSNWRTCPSSPLRRKEYSQGFFLGGGSTARLPRSVQICEAPEVVAGTRTTLEDRTPVPWQTGTGDGSPGVEQPAPWTGPPVHPRPNLPSPEVAELSFIRQYQSQGTLDTLNRGNILRLFAHIPSLMTLRSKDLLWVKFKELDRGDGFEATTTAWGDTSIRDLIFAQKSVFDSWGIELKIPPPSKYPFVLLGPPKMPHLSSILRGARGGNVAISSDKPSLQIRKTQTQRLVTSVQPFQLGRAGYGALSNPSISDRQLV